MSDNKVDFLQRQKLNHPLAESRNFPKLKKNITKNTVKLVLENGLVLNFADKLDIY